MLQKAGTHRGSATFALLYQGVKKSLQAVSKEVTLLLQTIAKEIKVLLEISLKHRVKNDFTSNILVIKPKLTWNVCTLIPRREGTLENENQWL